MTDAREPHRWGDTDNVDEALCPFCGKNCWGEGGFGDVCNHLVADWSTDPEANGGGVLGDQQANYHALDSASDLAKACQDLQHAIVGEEGDDAGWDARYQLFENALPPESRPAWWGNLCEEVSGQADAPIGDSPRELGSPATRLMPMLLKDAPGLKMTLSLLDSDNMGGSGESWFVWSQDPAAAAQEISKRITAATRVVHNVVKNV